ncbi:MAG: molybdenum cofactor guanylyltransferase [Thermoplasmata archaeon]|nr:molybdenum cofactor guanylyltransferase [Thermoplasmata archaeon]
MKALNEVSIAILTGGKSTRFGSNKLLFELEGKKLVQRVYDKVKEFSDDVFLQGSSIDGLAHWEDLVSDKSSLGGIYSALKNSKHEKTIVVAGDLPHIDTRMMSLLLENQEFDAVVPRWRSGHREPLCALYSKNLIPTIEEMFDANDLKISHVFGRAGRVKWIEVDALIESGGLSRECFKNLNVQEDLSG